MPDDGVATWSTTFCVIELLLDSIRADLGDLKAGVGGDFDNVGALLASLRADLGDLKTGIGGDFDNVGALLTSLRHDLEAVKTELGLLDIPPDTSPDVGSLRADVAVLKTDMATAKTNITSLQTRVGTLETSVSTLQTSVTSLQTRATNLETDVAALKVGPEPITFVFAGVPAVNSLINVPLTRNLSITSANLSANSRYYNVINPSSGTTTFQLRRMPANTLIGAFNVSTSGTISWTNTTGSTILAAGDTLRMTATAVGADVTDVAITIHATRRA